MFFEIVIFIVLGLIALRRFGWSSVSAIYNLVWAFSFVLISFNRDSFFQLDNRFIICILLTGFISLSFDILTASFRFKVPHNNRMSYIHFKILTIILLLLFPVFIRYITTLSNVGIEGGLLFRIRYATLQSGGSLGIMGVVVLLSTFHAVACLQHREHLGRYWVGLSFLLALAMQVLSAARTGLIALICAALVIYWLNRKSAGLRAGISAVIMILSSFVLTSWLRASGSQDLMSSERGLGNQINSLLDGLSLYFGSGPVAFSQVVDSSSTIISENYIWNNFLSTFGINTESLSGILPYSYIPVPTNIYSMFLPYYSYGGWIFVILGVSVIMVTLSLLFRMSSQGYKMAALFYSFGTAFIIQSPIGDGFLVGFPVWLQLSLYAITMYVIAPALMRGFRRENVINSYS